MELQHANAELYTIKYTIYPSQSPSPAPCACPHAHTIAHSGKASRSLLERSDCAVSSCTHMNRHGHAPVRYHILTSTLFGDRVHLAAAAAAAALSLSLSLSLLPQQAEQLDLTLHPGCRYEGGEAEEEAETIARRLMQPARGAIPDSDAPASAAVKPSPGADVCV